MLLASNGDPSPRAFVPKRADPSTPTQQPSPASLHLRPQTKRPSGALKVIKTGLELRQAETPAARTSKQTRFLCALGQGKKSSDSDDTSSDPEVASLNLPAVKVEDAVVDSVTSQIMPDVPKVHEELHHCPHKKNEEGPTRISSSKMDQPQKISWHKEEDQRLRCAMGKVGKAPDWPAVASRVGGGKTVTQCQQRWNKISNPGGGRGTWTAEEDKLIRDEVLKRGNDAIRWPEIAALLPGRLGKQCRERWHNHLDPRIKKGNWSSEEDRTIFAAQRMYGNRWCAIAKLLPGRSEAAIKNRWKSCSRRMWMDALPPQSNGAMADILPKPPVGPVPFFLHPSAAPIFTLMAAQFSAAGLPVGGATSPVVQAAPADAHIAGAVNVNPAPPVADQNNFSENRKCPNQQEATPLGSFPPAPCSYSQPGRDIGDKADMLLLKYEGGNAERHHMAKLISQLQGTLSIGSPTGEFCDLAANDDLLEGLECILEGDDTDICTGVDFDGNFEPPSPIPVPKVPEILSLRSKDPSALQGDVEPFLAFEDDFGYVCGHHEIPCTDGQPSPPSTSLTCRL